MITPSEFIIDINYRRFRIPSITNAMFRDVTTAWACNEQVTTTTIHPLQLCAQSSAD
jgi:hypothetical protein